METSDDRIKCYQCAKTSDACAKQDWDWKTLGSEITCPKGVRYCRIRQTGLQSFRRGCDSYLIDELNDDDLAFGLGGCTSSSSSETCACAQNKCNTGFHGENIVLTFFFKIEEVKNELNFIRGKMPRLCPVYLRK